MRGSVEWQTWRVLCALGMAATAASGAAGDLDPGFGVHGKVVTAIGTAPEAVATGLVRQPDGKLVAAGLVYDALGSADFAIARYGADGSLDPTFGSGGTVTTEVGTSGNWANALVLQSDGKLVAAGTAVPTENAEFALVRYGADGSLDPTFGSGGIVTTPVGGAIDQVRAIVQQPDGKLVAAGVAFGNGATFALARYATDGSLDPSFGNAGTTTTAIGGYDQAMALVRQPDGKLVVAGSAYNGTDEDFALVRYASDGSPDLSFGNGGIVTTTIGPEADGATALVLQPDGKIVAAGFTYDGHQKIALARYEPDGQLDATFGTDGIVETGKVFSNDRAAAIVVQPDGKLVVAGSSFGGLSNDDFAIARYAADGTLDLVFGSDGVVTISADDEANALALLLQPDGKLVAAGFSRGRAGSGFALARLEGGDTPAACGTLPDPECVQPITLGGARLLLVDQPADARPDRIRFAWRHGPVVPKTDFGSAPGTDTRYELCLYDDYYGVTTRIFRARLAEETQCAGRPCWSETPSGWRLRSKSGVPDGITRLSLVHGLTPGGAKITVKGRGVSLAPQLLPLRQSPRVIAELRSSGGRCWGASFSTALENDEDRFDGRSD